MPIARRPRRRQRGLGERLRPNPDHADEFGLARVLDGRAVLIETR